MPQLFLLRGAKQLLTLRGHKGVRRGAALRDLAIIEDASVLIRDGLIVEVGSTRRLENLKHARSAIEIPADGRIIVPGFVDASLRLSVSAARGDKRFHKRKSIVEFHDAALLLLRACLQHGTLTAGVKATSADPTGGLDLPMLRRLADIAANPICSLPSWHIGDTRGQNSSELLEKLRTILRKKLIRFIEFKGESGRAVDLELISALADSGIGIQVAWRAGNPDELVRTLEQFRPATVYCGAPVSLTAEEVVILGRAPSITVLGVGKEVFEAPPSRVGRDMVEGGAAIALSSGYDSGSAASFSMQMSLALAVVRLGLTVEEAFSAATINAAYALGRGEEIGSIEVGKRADLLLLNASDYREVPGQFGVNHVVMAIRDGAVVLNRTRWKAMHN